MRVKNGESTTENERTEETKKGDGRIEHSNRPWRLEKLVACSFKVAITIVITIDWKPRNRVRLMLEQNLPRWA